MVNDMKIVLSEVKPGDKLYVVRSYSGWGYVNLDPVTVAKVTPKGLIDVTWASGSVTRFGADGREYGNTHRRDHIDTEMTYEERTAEIERDKRKALACASLSNVKCEGDLRRHFNWSKEALLEQLDELQAKLDEARRLTEEI